MNLKDYQLVWEDTFDYEGCPDPAKWNFEVGNHQWPNRELQAYTDRPTNVFVKDGKLVIRAIKEQDGEREYTSAKMNTFGRQSWTYGYFEFKVKIPSGVGSWPAIWMMPEHIRLPREEQEKMGIAPENMGWPNCGEIDIMEHIGRRQNYLLFSLHCKNHNHANPDTIQYTTGKQFNEDLSEDYHVYGMEWTEDYIEYFVDGESCCRYNKSDDPNQSHDSWPFCKPFYLILNIAVGGGLGGPVTDEDLPFEMFVDYVRVYQKKF
uniref:glycoside hydrolase family 16 protein n=1 Tax=Acetatifactor sp. TaxID=1872090 RepID=UPI004055D7A2